MIFFTILYHLKESKYIYINVISHHSSLKSNIFPISVYKDLRFHNILKIIMISFSMFAQFMFHFLYIQDFVKYNYFLFLVT